MEETFGDGHVGLISKSVQMLVNNMLPMIRILSRNLKTTFRLLKSHKFLINYLSLALKVGRGGALLHNQGIEMVKK